MAEYNDLIDNMAMGKVSTDTQSTAPSAHAGKGKNKPVAGLPQASLL